MPEYLYPPTRRQRWLLEKCRRRGTQVVFGGEIYHAWGEATTGNNVGTRWLENAQLGAYSAKLDPHLFVLPAIYFAPYTQVAPPYDHDTLTWHARVYTITNVTPVDEGADTIALKVFAFRSE